MRRRLSVLSVCFISLVITSCGGGGGGGGGAPATEPGPTEEPPGEEGENETPTPPGSLLTGPETFDIYGWKSASLAFQIDASSGVACDSNLFTLSSSDTTVFDPSSLSLVAQDDQCTIDFTPRYDISGEFDFTVALKEDASSGKQFSTKITANPSVEVLGQRNSTENASLTFGLYNPKAIARVMVDGKKVTYIADTFNNRIVGYHGVEPGPGVPHQFALGQPNLSSNVTGFDPTKELQYPDDVYATTDYVAVADSAYNRVLIWKTHPTTSGVTPALVLGQADMSSTSANRGGGLTQNSLSRPESVFILGQRLFVGDKNNDRVMIWNDLSTAVNGQDADIVLGQANFVSRSNAITASNLNDPEAIHSDGTHLFVADYTNNRVLIWDDVNNLSSGLAADRVLGQADFASATAQAASASSLRSPSGIFATGSKLIVSQLLSNSRVSIFNYDSVLDPFVDGEDADYVLGRSNLTSSTNLARDAGGIGNPFSPFVDEDKLYVPDSNNRIGVWNDIPAANGDPHDGVIGQKNLAGNSSNVNHSSDISFETNHSHRTEKYLTVTDWANHRVLVWLNPGDKAKKNAPDIVIGQPDLSSANPNHDGISAKTLNAPTSAYIYNDSLIIADSGNQRILIFNKIPTENFAAADVVVGQPDFTSNGQGRSASTLSNPRYAFYDGTYLVVVDQNNNRVLIKNGLPTTNGESFEVGVGVSNLTSSGTSYYTPEQAIIHDGKLIVVAAGLNNFGGVLIWNTVPTVTGTAFDIRIANSQSFGATPSASSVYDARGLTVHNGNLYVADSSWNRILRWDGIPSTNNQAAVEVFGQANFTSNAQNSNGLGLYSLDFPIRIESWPKGLLVPDADNARVLIWHDDGLANR